LLCDSEGENPAHFILNCPALSHSQSYHCWITIYTTTKSQYTV
jgi:hypothetical protein